MVVEEVEVDLISDFVVANGYESCKRESYLRSGVSHDQYFQHMDNFIDDKLEMVAERLKEKKVLTDLNNKNKDNHR